MYEIQIDPMSSGVIYVVTETVPKSVGWILPHKCMHVSMEAA